MLIDQCTYTFEELASQVLPDYFMELEQSIKNPFDASTFIGKAGALKLAGLKKDFSGCYVFLSEDKPVYVGISRKVFHRLNQHLNIATHNAASLVYKMASNDYPHEMKRAQAMKDDVFKDKFLQSQKRLKSMKFAFVEIENPLELYLFEAYAAMKLDTGEWNTFKTH